MRRHLPTERFLKVAVRAAKAAGEIQRRRYGKVRSIRFKGEINLVTDVDKACEETILKILSREFPDHDILTEESGAVKAREAPASPGRARGAWGDGARVERSEMGQRSPQSSEFKWMIDPLDGTTNYAHGYPLFCASIGLEHKGRMVLGVVYEPNRRELFVALSGRGATLNGKRIRVSRISPLKRALLATGFAYSVQTKTDNNLDHFRNFIMSAQAVRRDGVAAVDLCYVACGRYDGFWELDLWPWDTAAALVIVEEAGGTITRFQGGVFHPSDREVVASNGLIHQEMLKVLGSGGTGG